MTASGFSSCTGLLGYLTFVESATYGMVGGYLLVTQYARPVEFHCTAPVRATRAHEILYGPTLRWVLCSDQMGQALFQQSKLRPQLLLTDEPEALGLRANVEVPIALFINQTSTQEDSAQPNSQQWSFAFGGRVVTSGTDAQDDRQVIERALRQLGGQWDLAEPLDRIRAAIHEARRAVA